MTLKEKASYLGDGVYAIFDGHGVWLRANDHRELHCTDKIYLEPEVLAALDIFLSKHYNLKPRERREE